MDDDDDYGMPVFRAAAIAMLVSSALFWIPLVLFVLFFFD